MRRYVFLLVALLVCSGFTHKKASDVYVQLQTSKGLIELKLDYQRAPQHVNTFLNLVKSGFYEGLPWHYVIPGKLAQTGDGLRFDRAYPPMEYLTQEDTRLNNTAGAIGFDRLWVQGEHRLTPQFYLLSEGRSEMNKDHPHVFGHITRGEAVLRELRKGDRLIRALALPTGSTSATPPAWANTP